MIDVAVAVIVNAEKKMLLAQRLKHQFKGGYWEFPGGKVEVDETVEQALIRELQEEVNLSPENIQRLDTFEYHYDTLSVRLHVYFVHTWQGELKPCLNQKLVWASLNELNDYRLPEANQQFLPLLREKLIVADC